MTYPQRWRGGAAALARWVVPACAAVLLLSAHVAAAAEPRPEVTYAQDPAAPAWRTDPSRRGPAQEAVVKAAGAETSDVEGSASPAMLPPPDDGGEEPITRACVLSNGCPGEQTQYSTGAWSTCRCAGAGDRSTVQAMNTGTGCMVEKRGVLSCNSSCQPSGFTPTSWKSATARFDQGLRAFNRVFCGGRTPGTCPFVDPVTTSSYGIQVKTADGSDKTPAPLSGSGCGSPWADASGCRFATSSSNVLAVSLDTPDDPANPSGSGDWVSDGNRNELAVFKENCDNTKYYMADGDNRYYSFSVFIPADFPYPPPKSQANSSLPTLVWQVHEAGGCVGGGPVMHVAIKRTDDIAYWPYEQGINSGNDYNFFPEEKQGYFLGAKVERLPSAPVPRNIGFQRGIWHHFVIHRYWTTGNTGKTRVWHIPEGGGYFTWAHDNYQTLWTWPSSDLSPGCEYHSPRTPGTVMPFYVQQGIYSGAFRPDMKLQYKNVRQADTCADVWVPEMGSTKCPGDF